MIDLKAIVRTRDHGFLHVIKEIVLVKLLTRVGLKKRVFENNQATTELLFRSSIV